MTCSACGDDIGYWEWFGGHSAAGVCKKCRAKASNLLRLIVSPVVDAEHWNHDYAKRWLAEFEETVRRYSVPESEAAPLRSTLLNNIFRLIESENEIPNSDINLLNELAEKYKLGPLSTPEIQDTLIRIVLHEAIQSWERGIIPTKQCNGLILQEDEDCHWEEVAGLRVQKTKHEYVGTFSSISVPIARGVRFRFGAFNGTSIDKDFLEDKGTGILHITSQRVCFTGQQQSVAIPYKKMISMGGFKEGFIVQTSNEKKPGIFIVRHPELTVQLVTLASARHEEDNIPRKGRKKLPPTE